MPVPCILVGLKADLRNLSAGKVSRNEVWYASIFVITLG